MWQRSKVVPKNVEVGKNSSLSRDGYITVQSGLRDGPNIQLNFTRRMHLRQLPAPAPRAVSIKRTNKPLVSAHPSRTRPIKYFRPSRTRPHRSQSPTSIITPVIQWLLISICVYGITMRSDCLHVCVCFRYYGGIPALAQFQLILQMSLRAQLPVRKRKLARENIEI